MKSGVLLLVLILAIFSTAAVSAFEVSRQGIILVGQDNDGNPAYAVFAPELTQRLKTSIFVEEGIIDNRTRIALNFSEDIREMPNIKYGDPLNYYPDTINTRNLSDATDMSWNNYLNSTNSSSSYRFVFGYTPDSDKSCAINKTYSLLYEVNSSYVGIGSAGHLKPKLDASCINSDGDPDALSVWNITFPNRRVFSFKDILVGISPSLKISQQIFYPGEKLKEDYEIASNVKGSLIVSAVSPKKDDPAGFDSRFYVYDNSTGFIKEYQRNSSENYYSWLVYTMNLISERINDEGYGVGCGGLGADEWEKWESACGGNYTTSSSSDGHITSISGPAPLWSFNTSIALPSWGILEVINGSKSYLLNYRLSGAGSGYPHTYVFDYGNMVDYPRVHKPCDNDNYFIPSIVAGMNFKLRTLEFKKKFDDHNLGVSDFKKKNGQDYVPIDPRFTFQMKFFLDTILEHVMTLDHNTIYAALRSPDLLNQISGEVGYDLDSNTISTENEFNPISVYDEDQKKWVPGYPELEDYVQDAIDEYNVENPLGYKDIVCYNSDVTDTFSYWTSTLNNPFREDDLFYDISDVQEINNALRLVSIYLTKEAKINAASVGDDNVTITMTEGYEDDILNFDVQDNHINWNLNWEANVTTKLQNITGIAYNCDDNKCSDGNITYINNAAPEVANLYKSSVYNIPLMTLQGRNGFSFPLLLSYSPGIKLYDEASWTGLGWNMNLMAITRAPLGYPDDNGGFISDSNDKQDKWLSPFGRLVINDSKSFVFENWKPYNISYTFNNSLLASFKIIDDSGNVYIFGKPVYSRVDGNINRLGGGSYNSNLTGGFAYAWYLTEMQSSDYVDVTDNGLSDDDYGNWIKFSYDEPEALQDAYYRFPTIGYARFNSYNESIGYDTYLSFSYLKSVENSLFVVNLSTSNRSDAGNFLGIFPLKLDNMTLINKLTGNIISAVRFDYNYSLGGKLTLASLQQYGNSGSSLNYLTDPKLPAYYFNYAYNPNYTAYAYDAFGYYNGKTGNNNTFEDNNTISFGNVSAWSLTAIKTPLGGWTNFTYESNSYDYVQNESQASQRYGPGLRIKSTIVSDGLGNVLTTNYNYSDGTLTYKPNCVGDSCAMQFDGSYSSIAMYDKVVNEYKKITTDGPGDYGTIEDNYATSRQYADPNSNGFTSIDKSHSYKRGFSNYTVFKNSLGDVVKSITRIYESANKGSFTNSIYQSGLLHVISIKASIDGFETTTDYGYDWDDGVNYFVETVFEGGEGSSYRTTDFTRAYRDSAQSSGVKTGMKKKNMLSQIGKVEVSDTGVKSKTQVIYNDFGSSRYYPKSEKSFYDISGGHSLNVTYDYDNYGNIVQYNDANGNKFYSNFSTFSFYPERGWNEEYGNINSPAWRNVYDDSGNAVESYDANNQLTEFEYDEFGRLESIESPTDAENDPSVRYEYYLAEDNGGISNSKLNYVKNTQKIYNDTDKVIAQYSDGIGRTPYSTIDDGSNVIVLKKEYNDAGALDKEYNPYKVASYYTTTPGSIKYTQYAYYDEPLMRLESVSMPDSGLDSVSYSYAVESVGNYEGYYKVTETSGGISSAEYFDKPGNLRAVEDRMGNFYNYDYDVMGRNTKVTTPLGKEITYEFDDIGRLETSDYPLTGETSYAYDNANNKITVTDAKLNSISYYYDKLNRLNRTDYPSGTDINWYYDVDMADEAGCTDNYYVGELGYFTDGTGSTYHCYDKIGRLVNFSKVVDSVAGLFTYVSYNYDDSIASLEGPNGRKQEFEYNHLGQLGKVKPEDLPETVFSFDDSDNKVGLLKTKTFNSGTSQASSVNYGYNDAGQVDYMGFSKGSLSETKEYNGQGVISSKTISSSSSSFTSDNNNRITGTSGNLLGTQGRGYNYDGQITWTSVDGVVTNYIRNADTTQLISDGIYNYSYDANGNVILAIDAVTGVFYMNLTYDYDNRAVEININESSGMTKLEYGYDALGEKVFQKKNGKRTIFSYFNGVIIDVIR